MAYGVRLHVWGEYACFTRPEMKVERVSYDAMTPSAARGILEAIHWRPAIRWLVDRIHVLKPIRFENLRRNELGGKIATRNVRQAMKAGTTERLRTVIEDDRQQRAATLLRDVAYVIEVIFWQAPGEALEAAGIEPLLLHAQFVKQVQGRKSDVADSLWLARICQFGLCRPSYVPPRDFRQLRQLSRYRRKLVGERSRARNRIHKTLDHDGLRLGGALTDIFGLNGRKILAGLAAGRSKAAIRASLSGHVRRKRDLLEQVLEARLDPHAVWKLRDLLRAHDAASVSIAELDARLEAGLAEMGEQVRLLETVPGIDRGSACAILVELGPDLSGFDRTVNVAAWAGVAPGNNESAGKRRSGRLRRGNATLRATLAECAHGAVRTQGSQFHGHHQALKARMPYKRAILATAHKLLRTIVAMLRDNRPYIDPGIDYDKLLVDRNAARWLRKLDEHGYLQSIRAGAEPAAT